MARESTMSASAGRVLDRLILSASLVLGLFFLFHLPLFLEFDISGSFYGSAFSFEPIFNTTGPLDVRINSHFGLNGTVTCRQGACENVTVTLRYNETQPDQPSSTVLESGSPFYVKQTPYVCGYLNQDQSCSVSFNVTATGIALRAYSLDLFVQSNLSVTSLSTRKVTSCWDTDGQCTSSNLVLDDNVYESVNLKTGGFGIINATAFNNSVTDGAFIESANITVIWKTDVGVGAGNLYVEYQYDGTWNVCAGPLGEQDSEITTTCDVSSLNSSELNSLEVRVRGNDTDGVLPAFLSVDYIAIRVNSSTKNDSSNLVVTLSSQYDGTLTAGVDQTGDTALPETDPAAGGQVTALTLTASSQTNQWQGYFGQLTGTVILEDNSNNQLYNWTISTVAGSLFVTNASSVTWASIQTHQNCGTTGGLDFYTSSSATNDKVSNTFTNGTFAALTVGTVTLGDGAGGEGTCTVDLFDNTGVSSSTWEENLLNDTSGQVWQVFLRNNQAGFNSTNMDFEMIVPEDNAGNSATKTYNFYAELS